MENYVTGTAIRTRREQLGITQQQLADRLAVSNKTISKWENGRGLPDITLLEPLAAELKISLPELLAGEQIVNANRSANLLRSCIYVCPVCGNVIHAMGQAMISCCGVTLPVQSAEEPDPAHQPVVERVEDEWYVTLNHPMTKDHYISFIALSQGDRFNMVKLYPEGNAEARFFTRGHGILYWYCNHHGLFMKHL
jgi:desulfoferrodoxin (superoxide reductase-like protein)/DNA-binding XRE family transcriptional regulator